VNAPPLLAADEPPSFEIVNAGGGSRAVVTCDHASNRMPRALGTLGLAPEQLQLHVAWDIGAAIMAERLAQILDAPLIRSGYSRLVIDLNRPLSSPASIPPQSEVVRVPGNEGVTPEEAARRADALFHPYHAALACLLDERIQGSTVPVYIAMHSFTPIYFGEARHVEVCVAWRKDDRVARLVLPKLEADGRWRVVANDPFVITPQGDYGIPHQAEARGLPCVMIELRQDLVERADDARAWGERLAAIIGPLLCHPNLQERREPPEDLRATPP
jgi:predicted N-formylglutamate amidohydrolase